MAELSNLLKTRKGLSTAVSSLIILVISVLLATVVTYYAINVTSARVEEEAVYIQKFHVWVNSTDCAGAFVITNTGGNDFLIDKICVRSEDSSWSNVYYWRADEAITGDLLIVDQDSLTGSSASLTYSPGKTETFNNASATGGDIPLASGGTLVIYFKNPDSMTINDVGTTVSLTVHTVQAEYTEECNVQSATPNPT